MNWKKKIMLGVLLTMTSAVQANNACYQNNNCCPTYDCCNDSDCCDFLGGFSIYADYLLWRARTCQLDYAVPYTGTASIGDVHSVCPEYKSGFRVGLAKECNCWVFGFDYTWFRDNEHDSFIDTVNGDIGGTRIVDDFSVVTQGAIAYAAGEFQLDYDTVNVWAGSDFCLSECFDARVYGGATFAFVDQTLTTQYANNANLTGTQTAFDLIAERVKMDCYGVTVGFSPNYRLSNCFGVFGTFSYDSLVTKFDRNLLYVTSGNGGTTLTERANLTDDCWGLVGVLNLSLGLKYIWQNCMCNQDLEISVGYEFHNWINTLGFLDMQADGGEVTFDRYLEGLGFDGLFVRLAASF